MYDAATSARDPLFYSWHKFIDNIFTEYQGTLKPYNKYQVSRCMILLLYSMSFFPLLGTGQTSFKVWVALLNTHYMININKCTALGEQSHS